MLRGAATEAAGLITGKSLVPSAPRPRNGLWLHAATIATVAGVALLLNARLDAPPRFDGAGYAVLARSLLQGSGYRAIDHPDAPRHAHFPPGYPLVLAGLWAITGPSNVAAHAFSIACTIAATLVAHRLFRSWYGPQAGLILGLSLAINWRWSRDGSAIQSEPLFLLLSLAAVLMARRPNARRAVGLGLILGFATLVRHVGVCVIAAILVDLILKKRPRAAIVAGITAMAVLSPWVAWMLRVGRGTQVGLLPGRNGGSVLAENAIFYTRRLPDQVFGPIIEVSTVFRPSWSAGATFVATILSAAIAWGWVRLLKSRRKRLAGLVPGATLALLLIWPFTEAGRFLVPLIPFLLAGLTEALGQISAKIGRPRRWAPAVVLAVSIPYSLYAIASGRAEAGRRAHRDFDRACGWITHQDDPGTVLTRHPGEVFLLSGRKALSPPDGASTKIIEDLLRKYHVAFLLIDEMRYARAPTTPLERFVAAHPRRVERVHGEGSVVVYRIKPG